MRCARQVQAGPSSCSPPRSSTPRGSRARPSRWGGATRCRRGSAWPLLLEVADGGTAEGFDPVADRVLAVATAAVRQAAALGPARAADRDLRGPAGAGRSSTSACAWPTWTPSSRRSARSWTRARRALPGTLTLGRQCSRCRRWWRCRGGWGRRGAGVPMPIGAVAAGARPVPALGRASSVTPSMATCTCSWSAGPTARRRTGSSRPWWTRGQHQRRARHRPAEARPAAPGPVRGADRLDAPDQGDGRPRRVAQPGRAPRPGPVSTGAAGRAATARPPASPPWRPPAPPRPRCPRGHLTRRTRQGAPRAAQRAVGRGNGHAGPVSGRPLVIAHRGASADARRAHPGRLRAGHRAGRRRPGVRRPPDRRRPPRLRARPADRPDQRRLGRGLHQDPGRPAPPRLRVLGASRTAPARHGGRCASAGWPTGASSRGRARTCSPTPSGGILTLPTLLDLVTSSPRPVLLAIETKHPTRYAGLGRAGRRGAAAQVRPGHPLAPGAASRCG